MKKNNEQRTNRQVKRILRTAKFLRVTEIATLIAGFMLACIAKGEALTALCLVVGVLVSIVIENLSFRMEQSVGHYRCETCGERLYPTQEELDNAEQSLFKIRKKLVCAGCHGKTVFEALSEKKETL